MEVVLQRSAGQCIKVLVKMSGVHNSHARGVGEISSSHANGASKKTREAYTTCPDETEEDDIPLMGRVVGLDFKKIGGPIR
ncbi:hypothetical protein KY290_010495 [Solanum tuberosum]|uniref:Uncharacterized protein n=1 Tax=Solanum tuberosum TaxID=4113 RepID=A0ABQ7VXY2_SOLTU|nr:hypothetical protein KY284_010378 [Solanum tuberosum]KAH0773358.1 hypothetical protein KY290_010495 [Solanum tuberosum]